MTDEVGVTTQTPSSWTVTLRYLADSEEEWLMGSEDPTCPVEHMSIRKNLVPVRPDGAEFVLLLASSARTADRTDKAGVTLHHRREE